LINKSVKKPLIIINFKAYAEGTGEGALKIAKIAKKVSNETGKCIALAPQFADIRTIAQEFEIPIFSQHIDPIEPGAHTGKILPESIKEAGAIGTLINHSERQIKISNIEETIFRAKSLKLTTVVCASTANISMSVATLDPDMVAIEPPELIGKGRAVSKVNPEIITNTVSLVRKVNPRVAILCGAGITNGDDIKAAIKLGADGVLLASGVVKAKEQESVLFDLASQI
jgi:triosephosphate isomerase